MNGYYILAIVFIAVAAGLVVTYHSLSFKFWWGRYHAKRKNFDDEGRLYRLKNMHFSKFFVPIIIIGVLGATLLGVAIGVDENSERELTEYQARYKTAISLTDGDFYKYSGNQLAKETIDIAEWVAKVNWSVDRYGRFSPYYSLKGRVRLTIGGAEQW